MQQKKRQCRLEPAHDHTAGPRKLFGHRGVVLWFTGLSGSGKSTIAQEVEHRLHLRGCHTYVLNGDNAPHGLKADPGFFEKDRQENIRRLAELVKLYSDSGVLVPSATVFRQDTHRYFNQTGLPLIAGQTGSLNCYQKCAPSRQQLINEKLMQAS